MNAIRNLLLMIRSHTVATLLNVFGLAIAFAVFYMIMVQVVYELSYNKTLQDSNRIVMIQTESVWSDKKSWIPNISRAHIELFGKDNPYIRHLGLLDPHLHSAAIADGTTFELRYSSITPPTFSVFGFEFVEGDSSQLVGEKNIALSQKIATRLGLSIGDKICVSSWWQNEIAKFDAANAATIVALYKDFPRNSDMGNIDAVWNLGEKDIDNSGDWNYNAYIKLTHGSDFENCQSLIKQQFVNYSNLSKPRDIRLIQIVDTYFNAFDSEMDVFNTGESGSRAATLTLLAIAIVLIAIASINFVNFFLALIPGRVRSVNTKRILGATVFSLRFNFLIESVLLVFISLVLSIVIVQLTSGSELSSLFLISVSINENISLILLLPFIAVALAILSALYPAWYVTSFSPAFALKGCFGSSQNGKRFRNFMVALQFTISFTLIISALFIYIQNQYMMNADMGFERDCVLTTKIQPEIAGGQTTRDDFAQRLKRNSNIEDVTFADGELVQPLRWTVGRDLSGPLTEGLDKSITFAVFPVSWNFLNLTGIEVVDGRNFIADDEFKGRGGVIFNLCAKEKYNITTENGINITGYNNSPIIGFCNNFNYRPMQLDNDALAFYIPPIEERRTLRNVYIKISANSNVEGVISFVENEIEQFAPFADESKSEIVLLNDDLKKHYAAEQKKSLQITLFALIAIVLSLMGVFTAVLFETQYRAREIALRRVNGSTVKEILKLFSLKYIKILLVSYVISVPISYYAVTKWLQGFANKTELHIWVFFVVLFAVLTVTVLIIVIRCLRAARTNPTLILNNE